ncbi:MAG: protein kinase domain-containing protein [Wenzhouxiangella sp.]
MGAEAMPRLSPARRRLLDRLLDHFLDLQPQQQAEELAQLGRRCPRLHRWLDRLLAASAMPTEQFSGAVQRTAERVFPEAADLPRLAAGDRLGPWRVLGPAGRGGMGVVYQAERADGAFEMAVAIKLIVSRRAGLSERLVRERQLLARLNHSGISRLIDGGLTDAGHAYLVMSWVPGEDLCDATRTRLDPLEVFTELADALTHAHQRMVVHGDIKPANVRITPDGRVRLLDFGVARLLAEDEVDHDHGLRALTPAFAAPELHDGQPATAQTDIWALGALLNWLLSGRRPRGDGSPPDSTALAHPRAADLAAVIAKACAPEPAERYPSVAALAEEIARIRDDFPVRARPVGPLRRLRFWAQRNTVGALLAVVLSVGAVAGASVLAWQAQTVRAERDLAQFENMRWEAMRDQLTSLFRVVAVEADNGELGARELLDGSVARLDELLAEDDEGRAYLLGMLGSLYLALQDYQSAAAVLRRFVEADDASAPPMLRFDAYGDLALAKVYLGQHARALELVEQALALVDGLAGDHGRQLSAIFQTRGSALRSLGDWAGSIESLEHAVALARAVDREPNRILAMAMAENNLGVSLQGAGRLDEARKAFEGSLSHWHAAGMGQSADALTVLGNLAAIYHLQGQLKQAEAAYSEAIEQRRQRFGESAGLAAAMNNYAIVLMIRYRLDEAAAQIEPAREMLARFNGEDSPHYALAVRSTGMLSLVAGDVKQALAEFALAESILNNTLGPEHLFTLLVQAQAAQAKAQIAPEQAAARFEEILDRLADLGRPAQAHKAAVRCEQAIVFLQLAQPEVSRRAAERCLDLRLEHLSPEHWEVAKAEALVAAAAYMAHGDLHARNDLAASLDTLGEVYGVGHPRMAWLEAQLLP